LSWTKTKISNPLRSDFKYLSDFRFLKNCRIPSDSDADSETVTSLLNPMSVETQRCPRGRCSGRDCCVSHRRKVMLT